MSAIEKQTIHVTPVGEDYIFHIDLESSAEKSMVVAASNNKSVKISLSHEVSTSSTTAKFIMSVNGYYNESEETFNYAQVVVEAGLNGWRATVSDTYSTCISSESSKFPTYHTYIRSLFACQEIFAKLISFATQKEEEIAVCLSNTLKFYFEVLDGRHEDSNLKRKLSFESHFEQIGYVDAISLVEEIEHSTRHVIYHLVALDKEDYRPINFTIEKTTDGTYLRTVLDGDVDREVVTLEEVKVDIHDSYKLK